MRAMYKRALSLGLAVVLTVVTCFSCFPITAHANSLPIYLEKIVHTVIEKPPVLPAEVEIDGVTSTVTWDAIQPSMLSAGRRFWVNGTESSGKQVAIRVQVDAHRILENFESSKASADHATVSGPITWSGASQSQQTLTLPSFYIENSKVFGGLNSLRVEYDFSKNHSGYTLSTYVRPENITFAAGEVPKSIGVWVYGNDLNYFKLRLVGVSAGENTVTINSDIGVEPLKSGWNFYKFDIEPRYQSSEFTIISVPGLISYSSSNGAKVPGVFYIDDITLIYGDQIKNTENLERTIQIAESYCTNIAGADTNEIQGVRNTIAAANKIMLNAKSSQQDIYDAEDYIVKAMVSLRNSKNNVREVILEDFEGASGIPWEYATTSSSQGKIEVVKDVVHNATSAMKLSYKFSTATGTALCAVKGSGYPNSKLTFTGENTPTKIGMWVYGKGQFVNALRLDLRKPDKSGLKNVPMITDGIIPEGWNYYTVNLAKEGFTKDTGILFNYLPSILSTSVQSRVDSEIYVDDITLIYEESGATGIKAAALIGEILNARALLIGAIEGNAGGQYPIGSLADLRSSIAGAISVLSLGTQEEINNTATELHRKATEFKNSLRPEIDLPGLLDKINIATSLHDNAVEGEEPNQYQTGAKAKLKIAIDSARAVYENSASTSQDIENAKQTLTVAIEDFNTKKVGPLDYAELDQSIAIAENLLASAVVGTNPGQYPKAAIDTFKSAKEQAVLDRTLCKTQANIVTVTTTLNKAKLDFDKAMVGYNFDKTKLNEVIMNAEKFLSSIRPGKLGGQYPQADYDIFKTAIRRAKSVMEDIRATEKAIKDEIDALNLAIETIKGKRIPAPWDKYSIPEVAPINKREMRGIWVSTVINIDWPSKDSLLITDDAKRIEKQKAELIKMFDDIKELGANTIFYQVRPMSDAFYKSNLAPWSLYLTGTYGKDPGFDPLQFAIEEAHKRGLELHAWCNPYRVSMPPSFYNDKDGKPMTSLVQVKQMLAEHGNNVYAKHPDWIRVASSRLVLDPGIPEAVQYVEDCVMEIVNNYDVDGIHFDDYFYVGNNGGFDVDGADRETYEKYGKAQFANIDDWRRNNTYTLIKGIHEKINTVKPWVKFGVSPAGVWRNKSDDPLGSDTRAGIPNYDHARADTRKWALEEIIDYICPQIYWSFNLAAAPYGVIATWWADLLKAHPDVKTELYTGIGAYRVDVTEYPTGTGDPYWDTEGVGAEELERQLKLNMANPNIDGASLFTYHSLYTGGKNSNLALQKIRDNLWSTNALVPSKYWVNIAKPQIPVIDSVIANTQGVTLTWQNTDKNARYFAIYRFGADEVINIENPKHLIERYYPTADTVQTYIDTQGKAGDRYVVTALNRVSEESIPSKDVQAKQLTIQNEIPDLLCLTLTKDHVNEVIISKDSGKKFDFNTELTRTELNVKELLKQIKLPQNYQLLEAYNFNIVINGTDIEPTEKLNVKIKLSADQLKMNGISAAFINKKGEVVVLESTIENGYLCFKTDDIHTLGILKQGKAPIPNTGDVGIQIFVILAIVSLGGLVVSKKAIK